MKLGLCALAVLALLSSPAIGQDKGMPVEITADKTLEWHREQLQYVARGNAVVKKGNTTIKADLLTADYRATKKSGTDIYRITGEGNVSIDDNGNIATGDKVIYDLDTGLATMTGSNLQMASPEQTVTATENFQYALREGRVKAIGNAKLVRGNDTLHGDQIDAVLGKDANGNQVLDRMEAKGNVKIVTPAEVLTGSRAVYNARTNTAIITGNVKITRDQNVLTGGRAEVDLTTNISRLFGSSIEDGQTGGRVKGVFYPGSEKPKPTQPAQTQ
jgi:lipopolysaccharide export system protein LptA